MGNAMFRSILGREDWNQGLLRFPSPHVLQTWEWGEVKAQTGWTMHAMRLLRGDEAIAQALVLRREVPVLPMGVGYVPKGPILDWENPEHVAETLDALQRLAHPLRLLFIKIDPDVDPDTPAGQRVIALLRERGWRPSPEQIQFRNTVLVDLQGSEEEILQRMKSKWRYNIRLATRRGVRVREGTLADLPTFYALYEETARRDRFLIRPFAYYKRVWEHFLRRGMAHLLLAEWEGTPVAGLMLFVFGERAWYMYGASAGGDARRHMPNHLLQWEAIRLARARGCTTYDMWGAPDELREDDPMWGVYRFKAGFGGTFQRWIGAWDWPAQPWGYRVYVHILPRVMHSLSRLLTRMR